MQIFCDFAEIIAQVDCYINLLLKSIFIIKLLMMFAFLCSFHGARMVAATLLQR